MTIPRLKMVLFTSKDCPTCRHVKKNVLPHFQKAHPDFKIEEVSVGLDAPGDDQRAEARADAYDVEGLPTIVFEIEGLPRGGGIDCTLNGLNKLLKEAEEGLKKAAGA